MPAASRTKAAYLLNYEPLALSVRMTLESIGLEFSLCNTWLMLHRYTQALSQCMKYLDILLSARPPKFIGNAAGS